MFIRVDIPSTRGAESVKEKCVFDGPSVMITSCDSDDVYITLADDVKNALRVRAKDLIEAVNRARY